MDGKKEKLMIFILARYVEDMEILQINAIVGKMIDTPIEINKKIMHKC